MNLPELLLIKYPNISFLTDIKLQDDGEGAYIKEWNLEVPKPSSDQIALWMKDIELQKQVVIEQSIGKLSELIDLKAQEKGYDDAVSISTYRDSTNTTWSAEATAFMEWRDHVWEYAIVTKENMINGGQLITYDQFISSLPILLWPKG